MAASGEFPQEGAEAGLPGLIACSPAMQEVCRVIRRVASTRASVLICGEPGAGKSTLAESIHRQSDRRSGSFVRLDCGAIGPSEFSDDLFETANGTLFLAEIDRLPPDLQTRLLRAMQKETSSSAGPRVIAASGCELAAEVDAGRFREDLYWALNVVPLEVLPLRARSEDIPALANLFLEQSSPRNGRQVKKVAREAIDALQAYAWPGNIPELRAYVERAVVMAEGEELSLELLPQAISGIAPIRSGGLSRFDLGSLTEEVVAQGIAAVAEDDPNPGLHRKIVDSVERELMLQVLRGCNGVRTQAAARLGINRNTLHKKIKEYGLDGESSDSVGGG